MKRLLLGLLAAAWVLSCVATAAEPIDVRLSQRNRFRFIGELDRPIGTKVTVQGYVIDGPQKGYEDGPQLRVQRINGVPTQREVLLKLTAHEGSAFLEGTTLVGVDLEARNLFKRKLYYRLCRKDGVVAEGGDFDKRGSHFSKGQTRSREVAKLR